MIKLLYRLILIVSISGGITSAIRFLKTERIQETTITAAEVGYPAPGPDMFTSPDEIVWPLCYDTDNGVYCKYPTPTPELD